MPIMILRVTNSAFESVSTGEFETLDDAYRSAVAAGVEIATGELSAGVDSAIVQVAVDLVGHRNAVRGAVALSTARIFSVPVD